MHQRYRFSIFLILLKLYQSSAYTYDKVDDTYYFIGNGNNGTWLLNWYEQRQICWDHHGELIYGLTADKMMSIERYIVANGYANGSLFSTSGYNYDSFRWSPLGEPLTYNKWLPGHEPLQDCNLSLQLIDGELYMVRTWGFDHFYICEYRTNWRRLWIFFNHPTVLTVSMVILCLVIFLVPCRRKKSPKDVEGFKPLITDTWTDKQFRCKVLSA